MNQGGIGFTNILNGISKTLNIVNQVIPIYQQVSPMVKNVKKVVANTNINNVLKNKSNFKVKTNSEEKITQKKELSLNNPVFFH